MRQPGKNVDIGRFARPVIPRRPPAEPAPHSMTARTMGELRADILAVRLQPDAELPLKILSYRYDVGLTPLREALTLLSGVGLVVHDRRGFASPRCRGRSSRMSRHAAGGWKAWRSRSPSAAPHRNGYSA